MPVNAVQIKNRSITQFSANLNGGEINIEGSYKLIIENTGVAPSPSSTFKVLNISHSSSGVTIISEQSKSIERLSPGSSIELSIPFSINGAESDLRGLAESGCSDSPISLDIQERITGILLVSSVEQSVSVQSSSLDCSLGSGDSDSQDDPGDIPVSVPEPQPTPEPQPEPEPEEPTNVNINIGGPEEVSVGASNTWTITGENLGSADEFSVDYGDGNNDTTTSRTITHSYSDDTVHVIVVEAILDGESVASASQTVSVTQVQSNNTSEEDESDEEPDEEPDEPVVGVDYAVQINGPDEVDIEQEEQWEAMSIEASNSEVYYEFNMGNGSSYIIGEGNTRNVSNHTYTQTGNYEIVVMMYDSNTDDELASDTKSVQVVSTPSADDSTDDGNIDDELLRRFDYKADGVIDEDELRFAEGMFSAGNINEDELGRITDASRNDTEFEPVQAATINEADSFMQVYNMYEDTFRRWDLNNNGELEESDLNSAVDSGNLTEDEEQVLREAHDNNRTFPQTQEYANHVRKYPELIAEYDENSNGEIDPNEITVLAADSRQDEIDPGDTTKILTVYEDDMRFPSDIAEYPTIDIMTDPDGGADTASVDYGIPSMDEI